MKTTLTADEAAAMLGVSRRTVFNMIRDGRLKTASEPRQGGHRIVTESAVAQQQQRMTRAGGKDAPSTAVATAAGTASVDAGPSKQVRNGPSPNGGISPCDKRGAQPA